MFRIQKKSLYLFCLLIGCLLSSGSLWGQDPMFSQFMFKQLYYNPANAGTTSHPRLMAGYRNQWPGMSNAFSSYYMTYDQRIESLKSGVGFSVLRDVISNSTFHITAFDFCYNYQIQASRDLNLSMGLSAGMSQKARSSASLSLPDQSPYQPGNIQEILPNTGKWYPDFGFGVYSLYKKRHWISLAVHHLNQPNVSLNEINYRYPLRFTFQYVTEFHQYAGPFKDRTLIYKPGIIYQQQSRYNYISLGSNFESDPLILGAWLRNDNNFAVESVILLMGYHLSNVTFIYSYDMRLINFSKNVINNGAHEVTFQMDLKYKERKKMRQVKCPKF